MSCLRKVDHFYFYDNFGKTAKVDQISQLFSLLNSERICRKLPYTSPVRAEKSQAQYVIKHSLQCFETVSRVAGRAFSL